MIELFKCIECKFAPSMLPVVQCQKGHVHCARCPGSGRVCITCIMINNCQESLRPCIIRSLAVQELLSSVPKQCPFIKHGCSEVTVGYGQHALNCPFSLNSCTIPHCGYTITLPKLLSHVTQDCKWSARYLHTIESNRLGATSEDKVTIPWNPFEEFAKRKGTRGRVSILKLGDEKYFLFSFLSCPVREKISIYTHFIGPPDEAKRYKYRFEIMFDDGRIFIAREASVLSAYFSKMTFNMHPDLIKLP